MNIKDGLNVIAIGCKKDKSFLIAIKEGENYSVPIKRIDRIILVGKMASGKDWLKQGLISNLNVKPEISYTTRPMREGEIPGQTYHFITKEKFEEMIKENRFYEYTKFVDWYYGTTHEEFEHKQIFIMNPEGLSKVRPEDLKNSFVFYLDIPENIRRERLANRDMNYDSIERRIKADEKDFANIQYDYRITTQVLINK